MNRESRFRTLAAFHRAALSGAVVAKARYLAEKGDPASTPTKIERARLYWQRCDMRRRALAAEMASEEAVEQWSAIA